MMRSPRPERLRPAFLASLMILGILGRDAVGGIILKSNTTTSTTFEEDFLNFRRFDSTAPQFSNDVLITPNPATYRTTTSNLFSDPTVTATTTADRQTLRQAPSTSNAFNGYGSGSISTTISSSVGSNGAVVGAAGISYNQGSFVASAASPPTEGTVAVVGITTSTAIFQVTSPGYVSLRPGVLLDVSGYLHGDPGDFVAVGLSGSITIQTPTTTTTSTFQLAGAYGGTGAGAAAPVIPLGGVFNTTSPPAGFDFELTASVILPAFATASADSIITIRSTLTLISDPNSLIQISAGPIPGGVIVPDFGVFAGGVDDSDGTLASPEPATFAGLIIAMPIAGMILRRRQTA